MALTKNFQSRTKASVGFRGSDIAKLQLDREIVTQLQAIGGRFDKVFHNLSDVASSVKLALTKPEKKLQTTRRLNKLAHKHLRSTPRRGRSLHA